MEDEEYDPECAPIAMRVMDAANSERPEEEYDPERPSPSTGTALNLADNDNVRARTISILWGDVPPPMPPPPESLVLPLDASLSRVTEHAEHANHGGPAARARKRTSPIMTKYELARIVGTRGLQLSLGHPPLIDTGDTKDWTDVASRELMAGKLRLFVRRHFEDQTFEDWPVEQLIIREQIINLSTV